MSKLGRNKGIHYGETKALVSRRQNFKCFFCGRDLGKWRTYGLDHLVPYSAGGANSHENRVAACRPCDNAKADRSPTAEELLRQDKLLGRAE